MSHNACVLHARHDLRIEEIETPPLVNGTVLVAMSYGGICGSDLHYYHDGGFGPIRVKQPIVLGHEISGIIQKIAPDVTTVSVGDRVAINPSLPCHHCHHCDRDEFQHCLNMQFLGSARTFPHVQGGFRSQMVVTAEQCHKIRATTSLQNAACAEPLAVCLHAAEQAGELRGKRVLVTGAGPIGALCCAVSAQGGAAEIVVTDLFGFTLGIALQMGATHGINVRQDPEDLKDYAASYGQFDVVFECSAAEPAILSALDVIRPRGTVVQVGVAGNISLPINAIVGKEVRFTGTHRFHPEFADAIDLIDTGEVDVSPILTQTFPICDAIAAFAAASNRDSAVKVQLKFDG